MQPDCGSNTEAAPGLPAGVRIVELTMHRDARGCFTEVFREEWGVAVTPIQWNAVHSQAGVLRGVHVHLRHADYLLIAQGRATIGLADLRPGSPTEGVATCVELDGDRMRALTIPPGVAHGFYFHESSLHIYAVTHYWDVADEMGCHWTDPALGIAWPVTEAHVSDRDARLPPLAALRGRIPPFSG